MRHPFGPVSQTNRDTDHTRWHPKFAAAYLGSSDPDPSGTATAHRNGAIAVSPNRLRPGSHAGGRMRSRDTRRFRANERTPVADVEMPAQA
jgi:hypothetical protein